MIEEVLAAPSRVTSRDFAFYYPGPMWSSSDAVKSLLPFFDGISLLVPRYLQDKPDRIDPSLAIPLRDRGMLVNLEPEDHLDKGATEKLAEALVSVIASGALDQLSNDGDTAFHELSMSRLGYWGDRELAEMLFRELKERNLARESEDGVSIPMHRHVRILILVLLSQILRPRGTALGIELVPTTDRGHLVHALAELLDLPTMPSKGNVIMSDMQAVGADLSSVPLDEVLDFRAQHAAQHRKYVRNVQQFVAQLSLLDAAQRPEAELQRAEEIADVANDLQTAARSAWKKPASVVLGATGAVWTITTGDFIGGLLALSGAAIGLAPDANKDLAGAYSFVFQLPRKSIY